MRDNEIEKAERNYKRFLSNTNEYRSSEREGAERINKRLLSDANVMCNSETERIERLLTTEINLDYNSASIRS
jgi:hypothetical protein